MTERLYNLFIAFRIRELLPKTGFALVGSLISIQSLNADHTETLFKVFLISFFTGLAVYALNSWADYETDQANPRLKETHRLSKDEFWRSIFLASIAAISFTMVWIPTIILAVVSTLLLWALYSLKPFRLKNVPFGGLALSFITQVVQFHIGYLAFSEPGLESIYYSAFFALLVSAGHLIHECIDLEADQKTNTQTTAVFLGLTTTVRLSTGLFILTLICSIVGQLLKITEASFSLIVSIALLVIIVAHPAFKIFKFPDLLLYRKFYLITFSTGLFFYAVLSKL